MKTLQDLKNRGIDLTDEIKLMVLLEIADRMEGKTDGMLHEPVSQIIANKFTLIKCREAMKSGEDDLSQKFSSPLPDHITSKQ